MQRPSRQQQRAAARAAAKATCQRPRCMRSLVIEHLTGMHEDNRCVLGGEGKPAHGATCMREVRSPISTSNCDPILDCFLHPTRSRYLAPVGFLPRGGHRKGSRCADAHGALATYPELTPAEVKQRSREGPGVQLISPVNTHICLHN